MSRTAFHRALLTVALVVPSMVVAQKPTAQSVFDKHAAAVGGIVAFKAAQSRTEVGTADITFAGVSGAYERKSATGKMLMTIDIGGFGQVVQGFDGTVAWSLDPQQGAQKLDAATSADAASSTTPTAGLWEAGSYTSAEVLDAAEFGGAKAWPVKIVGKSGRARTVYYDQSTGLKLGEVIQQNGGEQKIVYEAYKPFGALTVPTKVTMGTPNGDIIFNITALKFDPLDASVFALPDAVKSLP
jgi:hypothetical protein